MHSAIYTGQLRHRRFAPRAHAFAYRLFMMYVDLAELDSIFKKRWFWSVKRPALAWLRRADYLGDPDISLDQAVRDCVQADTGTRPDGPIRMLTHLRYFGLSFNPVTFYYCYDRDDTRIETIVAEITNTPWNERHAYVLKRPLSHQGLRFPPESSMHISCLEHSGSVRAELVEALWIRKSPSTGSGRAEKAGKQVVFRGFKFVGKPQHQGRGSPTHALRFRFKKDFHVSPFMAMNFDYDWRFSAPGERLNVHMENTRDGTKHFDATLTLKRREIRGVTLASTLLAFPCMTAIVIGGIYWQALKLWLKRIPFHSHPKHLDNIEAPT